MSAGDTHFCLVAVRHLGLLPPLSLDALVPSQSMLFLDRALLLSLEMILYAAVESSSLGCALQIFLHKKHDNTVLSFSRFHSLDQSE